MEEEGTPAEDNIEENEELEEEPCEDLEEVRCEELEEEEPNACHHC